METRHKIPLLTACTVFGIASLFIAFQLSERIIHYKNNFTRRYPPHFAAPEDTLKLNFNSYYLAGFEGGKIYLGNSTAPLRITIADAFLSKKIEHTINLDQKDMVFRSPHLKIFQDDFFLYEGSLPYIFKGSTSDWQGRLILNSGNNFSMLEPAESGIVAVRFIEKRTGRSILGNISTMDTCKRIFAPLLLGKQKDGVFDTDGYLHYDRSLKKVIYLSRYRNGYVAAGLDMKLSYRGKTIDTISTAQVEITKVKSQNVTTFARPPLVVNRLSAVDGGLLYVCSELPGIGENDSLWKTASIIDVYNIKDRSYRFSFPVFNSAGKKIRSFMVNGSNLYAMVGNLVIRYELKKEAIN